MAFRKRTINSDSDKNKNWSYDKARYIVARRNKNVVNNIYDQLQEVYESAKVYDRFKLRYDAEDLSTNDRREIKAILDYLYKVLVY